MTCTPARVTVDGIRYEISRDGTVRPTWLLTESVTDGCAQPTGETMTTRMYGSVVEPSFAWTVRREASRQRSIRDDIEEQNSPS